MKKNFLAVTALVLAIAGSAFTIPSKPAPFSPFRYSNNTAAPVAGANEITLSAYNLCPTGIGIVCGTKWDFAVPSTPVLKETRKYN